MNIMIEKSTHFTLKINQKELMKKHYTEKYKDLFNKSMYLNKSIEIDLSQVTNIDSFFMIKLIELKKALENNDLKLFLINLKDHGIYEILRHLELITPMEYEDLFDEKQNKENFLMNERKHEIYIYIYDQKIYESFNFRTYSDLFLKISNKTKNVHINLSSVNDVDSSFISNLILVKEKLEQKEKKLYLTQINSKLTEVFKKFDAEHLLKENIITDKAITIDYDYEKIS